MAKKGSSKRKIKKAQNAQLNRQEFRLSNEEMGKAFHGLRSSNAAQPHVPAHKKGTRSAKNRAAILEY